MHQLCMKARVCTGCALGSIARFEPVLLHTGLTGRLLAAGTVSAAETEVAEEARSCKGDHLFSSLNICSAMNYVLQAIVQLYVLNSFCN